MEGIHWFWLENLQGCRLPVDIFVWVSRIKIRDINVAGIFTGGDKWRQHLLLWNAAYLASVGGSPS